MEHCKEEKLYATSIRTRGTAGALKNPFIRYSPPCPAPSSTRTKKEFHKQQARGRGRPRKANSCSLDAHNKWTEYQKRMRRLVSAIVRDQHFIDAYIPEGEDIQMAIKHERNRDIVPVREVLSCQAHIIKNKGAILALFAQLAAENTFAPAVGSVAGGRRGGHGRPMWSSLFGVRRRRRGRERHTYMRQSRLLPCISSEMLRSALNHQATARAAATASNPSRGKTSCLSYPPRGAYPSWPFESKH